LAIPIDTLYRNARLATFSDPIDAPYGAVEAGVIAIQGDQIAFAGSEAELPACDARATVDVEGRWITPGLIDCHTHLVFGGNRADEFERRLQGVSYAEISREGGGINATVRATREESEEQLLRAATPRLLNLIREGVTTIEIKSGYGLTLQDERKQLRVARLLADQNPITVRTTFLGAHSVPPERKGDADGYVDDVVAMMPEIHREGLADAVDAFCESIGFSPEQTSRVLDRARELGLPIKLHADQLTDLGGAALAANYQALSADHLEYTSDAGVAAMKAAGTVAVLLPGAFYILRETKLPPIEALRQAGVDIAIATDLNPGSSPVHSLLLCLSLACTFFRMTPEEALRGVTRNAARALGLVDRGTLVAGSRADLAIWDIEHPAELAYLVGMNPLWRRVQGGRRDR